MPLTYKWELLEVIASKRRLRRRALISYMLTESISLPYHNASLRPPTFIMTLYATPILGYRLGSLISPFCHFRDMAQHAIGIWVSLRQSDSRDADLESRRADYAMQTYAYWPRYRSQCRLHWSRLASNMRDDNSLLIFGMQKKRPIYREYWLPLLSLSHANVKMPNLPLCAPYVLMAQMLHALGYFNKFRRKYAFTFFDALVLKITPL